MTAERFSKENELDLVILCGSPGVGKSTFFWNELSPLGYERVNQDILKTVSTKSYLSNKMGNSRLR